VKFQTGFDAVLQVTFSAWFPLISYLPLFV